MNASQLRHRGSWFRSWAVAALAGWCGYRLWGPAQQGDDISCAAAAALWIASACAFAKGLERWDFAAELRSLRRKSRVKEGEQPDEGLLDRCLLDVGPRPSVSAILKEAAKQKKCLEKAAAWRRLILLEAGVGVVRPSLIRTARRRSILAVLLVVLIAKAGTPWLRVSFPEHVGSAPMAQYLGVGGSRNVVAGELASTGALPLIVMLPVIDPNE